MSTPENRPYRASLLDISDKRTWPDVVEALEVELANQGDLPLTAILPVTRNGNTSGFILVRDNRGVTP